MDHILVLNDEAHHCYRRKPGEDDEPALDTEEKQGGQGQRRGPPALWINGLEAVGRQIGRKADEPAPVRVIDLSATPFFLRGSGYPRGRFSPGPSATSR